MTVGRGCHEPLTGIWRAGTEKVRNFVQSLLRALGPDSVGQTVALGVRRTGKTQQVSLKIT
jgi:hypothetical protein